jgi:hypothetical protein
MKLSIRCDKKNIKKKTHSNERQNHEKSKIKKIWNCADTGCARGNDREDSCGNWESAGFKMRFKWEMVNGCWTTTFFHTLPEIEEIIKKDTDPKIGPHYRRIHKSPKDFEIGDFYPGSEHWAMIERIE